MNTVMRTLGGALGGQLSATFIAENMVHGLPAVTGFTETFLMSAPFLACCVGAGLLIPARALRQRPAVRGYLGCPGVRLRWHRCSVRRSRLRSRGRR